jgi:hypothetical protein
MTFFVANSKYLRTTRKLKEVYCDPPEVDTSRGMQEELRKGMNYFRNLVMFFT